MREAEGCTVKKNREKKAVRCRMRETEGCTVKKNRGKKQYEAG